MEKHATPMVLLNGVKITPPKRNVLEGFPLGAKKECANPYHKFASDLDRLLKALPEKPSSSDRISPIYFTCPECSKTDEFMVTYEALLELEAAGKITIER